MRRSIASLYILGLLASSPAWGDIRSSSTFFSVICKIDHSIGFDWDNNEWVQAAFIPQTYVISKLEAQKNDTECLFYLADKDTGEIHYPSQGVPDVGVSKGCYRVKTLGQSLSSPLGMECDEVWAGTKGNSVLQSIKCEAAVTDEAFEFQINGEIVLTRTHSPFELKRPSTGERDFNYAGNRQVRSNILGRNVAEKRAHFGVHHEYAYPPAPVHKSRILMKRRLAEDRGLLRDGKRGAVYLLPSRRPSRALDLGRRFFNGAGPLRR